MYQQGQLNEAEGLYTQVLDRRRVAWRPTHASTDDAMYCLALTWQEQGKWDEAEQLMAEIVELRKEALGTDNPRTLEVLQVLASWREEREAKETDFKRSTRRTMVNVL